MDTQLSKRGQVWRFWREVFTSAGQQSELLSRRKLLTTLGVSIGALVLQYELSVRTLSVTVQIVGTVVIAYLVIALIGYAWNVVSIPATKDERLKSSNAELEERLRPRLELTFDKDRGGFVDSFIGQRPDRQSDNYMLYRVAVTSRARSALASLRIEEVTLKGGRTFAGVHLHMMHRGPNEQQVLLHPDVPQFWDVVKRPSHGEWIELTHAENMQGILLPSPCQFRVIASSSDGLSVSKIVAVKIDGPIGLDFRLLEETA